MTPEQLQKLKELRNALSCWQDDYDPTEDKEQYDMFGDAVDSVGRLEEAEALAEFRGKHVTSLDKLIADIDKRIAELTAVVDQRNAECDRLIIEKGLLRIKAAPGKPVAHFILVDGEYNQLASQFAESPDAIPLYATPPAPSAPDGWLLIPSKPSQAHLNSIAMRYRHDFYLLPEKQRDSAITTARQMYEECSGQGFYSIPKPAAPGGE